MYFSRNLCYTYKCILYTRYLKEDREGSIPIRIDKEDTLVHIERKVKVKGHVESIFGSGFQSGIRTYT